MREIINTINEILGEDCVAIQLLNHNTMVKVRYSCDRHDAEFSIIVSENTNAFIHEYVINKSSDEVRDIHAYKNGKGYYFNIHDISYDELHSVVVKYCEVLKTLKN